MKLEIIYYIAKASIYGVWLKYFGGGLPDPNWSIVLYSAVKGTQWFLNANMNTPVAEFRDKYNAMNHQDDGYIYNQVTVPDYFRNQSHFHVKEYITQVYGLYPLEEMDRWENFGPLEAFWIAPNNVSAASNETLYYIHGGGYFFGHPNNYFKVLDQTCKIADVNAFTVNYRLAPEVTMLAIFEDVLAAYLYLIGDKRHGGLQLEPHKIAVSGDSAGGSLTAQLIHFLRNTNQPMVAAGLLLSPVMDLKGSQPSIGEMNEVDLFPTNPSVPIQLAPGIEKNIGLVQFLWQLGNDTQQERMAKHGHPLGPVAAINWPMYSPIRDPYLRQLPPLMIISGENEMARDDSVIYATRIAEVNKDLTQVGLPSVILEMYESMPHAFHIISVASSSSRAVERSAHFIKYAMNATYRKDQEDDYVKTIAVGSDPLPKRLPLDSFHAFRDRYQNGTLELFVPEYDVQEIEIKNYHVVMDPKHALSATNQEN